MRIIAVSQAARFQLVTCEGVKAQRVRVIENGVDIERIDGIDVVAGRRVIADLALGKGPFVGCAARYDLPKGHIVLLEAFASVARAVPNARLLLLGQGPGEREVRARIRGLGLTQHVAVLGHHPLGHAVMAAMDVYVQPSIEEGFGLAVIEAMAMRRPVVVTDVGGMRETVEDGVSGIRVPPSDSAALAAALIRVLRDTSLAARFAEAGCARVTDRYSITRMLAEYDACYRNAMAQRRG